MSRTLQRRANARDDATDGRAPDGGALPTPVARPRRLRTTAAMRELVSETAVLPHQLVAPFFVTAGRDTVQPIAALPGVARLGTDPLLRELERALKLGIRSAVLFGVVDAGAKDGHADAADDPEGPVAQALRSARAAFGDDLVLVTDVCLCGYTDHGHCGLLAPTPRGLVVDNDASLDRLAAMAVAHAEAGADLVSPSDMMDGRVAAIRAALDAGGFENVGVLSYAVKYASAFYGPFRDAAGSAPSAAGAGAEGAAAPSDATSGGWGARPPGPPRPCAADRPRHLPDGRPQRPRGAARGRAGRGRGRGHADGQTGSSLPRHPGAPSPATQLPLVAYFVSGEYAMLKAAAAAGALDEPSAVREALTGIRRAGADLIITYHGIEALEKGWLV